MTRRSSNNSPGPDDPSVDTAQCVVDEDQHRRWLEASNALTAEVLSGIGLPVVLTRLASRARELVGADTALIKLTEDLDEVAVEAADGYAADRLRGLTMPRADAYTGRVLQSGEPLQLQEFTLGGVNFGPTVWVVLGSPQRLLGALVIANRPGGAGFSSEVVSQVAAIARQAALALDVTTAQADRQRLAVYADRDRIARDLHDLVIQRLFATGMTLQATASMVVRPGVAERVRQAVDDLDETIREIRAAIFELQSPTITAVPGLRRQLLLAIEEVSAGSSIAPTLQLSGPIDPLVPEVAEHLLAAVSEAVSNAVRHAEATHIGIRVDVAESVALEVTDDGRGMPARPSRSGLRNLEERARSLGGSCAVDSTPHHGTRLRWRVPLP